MAKVNFTQAELELAKTLSKIKINRLSELATIVMLMQENTAKIPEKMMQQILSDFQQEMKKLKMKDKVIYSKLGLTIGEEEIFHRSASKLKTKDWEYLKTIKEKIDDLKKEFYGQEIVQEKDEEYVEKQRLRHINKRFNIREGWLPLQ